MVGFASSQNMGLLGDSFIFYWSIPYRRGWCCYCYYPPRSNGVLVLSAGSMR